MVIKGKRGSHVGVIASFGIFILFLMGIIIVLEPAFKSEQENSVFVEYVKSKILENISGELTTVIAKSNGTGCQKLNDSKIGFDSSGINKIAKDENGNILDSTYTSPYLGFENNGDNVLWIYYSKRGFENTPFTGTGCNETIIKSIRNETNAYEEDILKLYSNFDAFKSSLNIPPSTDFSSSFRLANGTLLNEEVLNTSRNIFSETTTLDYVNKTASSLNGELLIKVW